MTINTLQFIDMAKDFKSFGLNLNYVVGVRYANKKNKFLGLYYICAKNERHKQTYLVKSYLDNVNLEIEFLKRELNARIIDIKIKEPKDLKFIIESM